MFVWQTQHIRSMDLTPKLSRPWWAPLGSCCAAPASSSNPAKCVDEDVAVNSRRNNCVVRWLNRNDVEKQEMAQRIDNFSAKKEHADEQIKDANITTHRVQERLNSITLIRDELLAEKISTQNDLERLKSVLQENEFLRGKVAEVTAARVKDVEAKDAAIKNLQSTHEQLNDEILESNENIAAKSSEVKSLQSSLAGVTLSRDELSYRKGVTQKELGELTVKMNEISVVKDSLLQENKVLCGKIAEVTDARKYLQEELENSTTTSRDKLAALQDSLEAKDAVIENLHKIIEPLNSKILELNEDIAAESSEAETLQNSLAAVTLRRDEMQKDLEELTRKMDEVSVAKNAMQRENEFLRGKVAEVTDGRENLQRELDTSTANSLAGATLIRNELLAEKALTHKELRELAVKMSEISAVKDSLLQENEFLCGKVAEVTDARKNLQEELEASKTTSGHELAALKKSLEAKDTVIENLHKILEQLNSKILESNENSEGIAGSTELELPAPKVAKEALVNLQQYLVAAQQRIEGADGNTQTLPHAEVGGNASVHKEGSILCDEKVVAHDAAAAENPTIKKKARRKLIPRSNSEFAEGEEGELGFGDIASVQGEPKKAHDAAATENPTIKKKSTA